MREPEIYYANGMPQRLVNLDVDDMERAVTFYTQGLQLRAGRRFGDGFVELLGADVPIYQCAFAVRFRSALSAVSPTKHYADETMTRQLKLATFNVNGVRSRLPHLLEWLAKESPDVVCLQELKAAAFPSLELRQAGYSSIWHGQRAWNGVAILAKAGEIIETRRTLPGADDDDQCRYLEAAVHGVLVACLYLPNGNPKPGPKFQYKLAWFERLIAHAQGLFDSGHPVALIGDFNVVPTDFDIYNTRSWLKDALLQPESRECFARLLAQGWLDVLRSRSPNERIYTFWDYLRQAWPRNAGLRIDHLLVSPSLAPRVTGAGVDTWVRGLPHASDHAPVWMTIDAR